MQSNLTPAEVRTIDTKEVQEKKIYKQWLKIFAKADSFQRLGMLMKIAILYNIHETDFYLQENIPWVEYCNRLHINRRTADRHLNVARGLIKMCPSAVTIIDKKFLFDSSKMEAEFKALLKGESGDITLESLARLGADANGLRNYFYDEQAGGDIKTADALTMLIGSPTSVTDQIPPPAKQDTLFSMHERILAAGFRCGDDGKYYNPDGSEMTDSQLSEFVDDEAGMKVFSEVMKVLGPTKNSLQGKIELFARYARLYRTAHQSPISEKLFQEKHEELIAECAGLLHDVSTIFESEEN